MPDVEDATIKSETQFKRPGSETQSIHEFFEDAAKSDTAQLLKGVLVASLEIFVVVSAITLSCRLGNRSSRAVADAVFPDQK